MLITLLLNLGIVHITFDTFYLLFKPYEMYFVYTSPQDKVQAFPDVVLLARSHVVERSHETTWRRMPVLTVRFYSLCSTFLLTRRVGADARHIAVTASAGVCQRRVRRAIHDKSIRVVEKKIRYENDDNQGYVKPQT